MPSGVSPVQSIDRVFDIVETLSGASHGMSLTDLDVYKRQGHAALGHGLGQRHGILGVIQHHYGDHAQQIHFFQHIVHDSTAPLFEK